MPLIHTFFKCNHYRTLWDRNYDVLSTEDWDLEGSRSHSYQWLNKDMLSDTTLKPRPEMPRQKQATGSRYIQSIYLTISHHCCCGSPQGRLILEGWWEKKKKKKNHSCSTSLWLKPQCWALRKVGLEQKSRIGGLWGHLLPPTPQTQLPGPTGSTARS